LCGDVSFQKILTNVHCRGSLLRHCIVLREIAECFGTMFPVAIYVGKKYVDVGLGRKREGNLTKRKWTQLG